VVEAAFALGLNVGGLGLGPWQGTLGSLGHPLTWCRGAEPGRRSKNGYLGYPLSLFHTSCTCKWNAHPHSPLYLKEQGVPELRHIWIRRHYGDTPKSTGKAGGVT
jgi:hypothetical protein